MENANSILVGNNDRDSTKCRTVPQGLLPTTTAESLSKKRIAVPTFSVAKGVIYTSYILYSLNYISYACCSQKALEIPKGVHIAEEVGVDNPHT